MPLPDGVVIVRVQGYLRNQDGTRAARRVTFDPTRSQLFDDDGHAVYFTRPVTASVGEDGYWSVDLIASDCDGLTHFNYSSQVYLGTPRTISVPKDSPVEDFGDDGEMPALWYDDAAATVTPSPGATYYTAVQVDDAIADAVEDVVGGGGGAVSSVNARTGAVTGLAEQSSLTSHTGNTSNPHSTTASQLGLGNVTNTSDANKPVSTAQQAAIDAVVAAIPETARDTIGTALAQGANVAITIDDAGNTITIGVTGLATVATTGSAADLTGTLDDARIPSGIARDAEVTSAISTAINNLINSAPGLLDTLGEIAAQLATDEGVVTALTTKGSPMPNYVIVSTDAADKVIKNGPILWDGETTYDPGPGRQAILASDAEAQGYTAPARPQADLNADQIRAKAHTALAANTTFLAIASPSNAQVLAQTKALTREVNALFRLVLGQFDDVSDT